MASGTLRFFFACFMPGLGAAAAGRQFLLSFGRSVLPVSVRKVDGAGFLGAVSISWLISDLAIPRSIFAAAVLRISSVT